TAEQRDRQAVHATVVRFEKQATLEAVAQEVLGDRTAVKRVQRLINRAVRGEFDTDGNEVRAPLVRIRVEMLPAGHTHEAQINQDLSRELIDATGVNCLVVNVSESLSDEDYASSHGGDQLRAFENSDSLHRLLARGGADVLANMLRNRDHIVIGGGRATGFLV